MACCKEIMMTVGVGGCIAVPNAPTPSDLVIVETVDFGNQTVSPVPGTCVADVQWPEFFGIGSYTVTYVTSFVTFSHSASFLTCPVDLRVAGVATGFTNGADGFSANLNILSGPTVKGLSCATCGLVNTCDTTALQANTLALNPVLVFTIISDTATSAIGYDGEPDVRISVSVDTCPAEFNTFLSGGSITWNITQTQHLFPQPKRVRIKDYSGVKTDLGNCPAIDTPANHNSSLTPCVPVVDWDGTFPYRLIIFPQAPNQQVQFFPGGPDTGICPRPPAGPAFFDVCEFSLNGMALAAMTFNQFETGIAYRSVAGVGWWELRIIGYLTVGYIQAIWTGKKFIGNTPEGLYDFDVAGSCASGPSTICVESY